MTSSSPGRCTNRVNLERVKERLPFYSSYSPRQSISPNSISFPLKQVHAVHSPLTNPGANPEQDSERNRREPRFIGDLSPDSSGDLYETGVRETVKNRAKTAFRAVSKLLPCSSCSGMGQCFLAAARLFL